MVIKLMYVRPIRRQTSTLLQTSFCDTGREMIPRAWQQESLQTMERTDMDTGCMKYCLRCHNADAYGR